MQLEYKSDFKSIRSFEPVELADCTVLTGVNGSGKTHLLKAVEEGHASIDGIGPGDAVFFNFALFKAEKEQELSRSGLLSMKKGIWDQFDSQDIQGIGNVRNRLREIKLEAFAGDAAAIRYMESVAVRRDRPLLKMTAKSIIKSGKTLAKSLERLKAHPRGAAGIEHLATIAAQAGKRISEISVDDADVNDARWARDLFKKHFRDNAGIDYLESIAAQAGLPLAKLGRDDIASAVGAAAKNFGTFKTRLKTFFQNSKIRNNFQLHGIAPLCNLLPSFPDQMTRVEFNKLYIPTALKAGFLPMQIGQIFLDHVTKEHEEFLKLCDENPETLPRDLRGMAKERCRRRYNGKTPWAVINDFLNEYGDFRYNITHPEPLDSQSYLYNQDQSFFPLLRTEDGSIAIQYDELSSGEEVLFALALCLFKTMSDNIFPKILLLDEVDASLHPSMVENLFRVIDNVFIKMGTRVILASHSPTTIALAPEGSVFVVNRPGDGLNRVEKRGKKEALAILTQGFATLDDGLALVDQISRKAAIVITEGRNTAYIKKAIELFAPAAQGKIDVLGGIEGKSGASQLKTLFEFFKAVQHDAHVFFVFDPDCTYNLADEGRTHAYIFAKNAANTLAERGIENLFDDGLFGDYTVTKTNNSTQEKTVKFNNDKRGLERRVIAAADKASFKNFEPLVRHIKETVGPDLELGARGARAVAKPPARAEGGSEADWPRQIGPAKGCPSAAAEPVADARARGGGGGRRAGAEARACAAGGPRMSPHGIAPAGRRLDK